MIGLAQNAGFKLAATSEINANPMDTKDYLAIGESDRMTLKFNQALTC